MPADANQKIIKGANKQWQLKSDLQRRTFEPDAAFLRDQKER